MRMSLTVLCWLLRENINNLKMNLETTLKANKDVYVDVQAETCNCVSIFRHSNVGQKHNT